MCNCNKINTCGEFNTTYATCVRYEGILPNYSKYVEDCDVTVEETIEELYTLVGTAPSSQEYFNGEGLNLTNKVFSANFGLTVGTVMEGSWRPDWSDVTNKPFIPAPVNLIAGENINITGTYPNLTVSAESIGQANLIEKVSLGGTQATVTDKTAMIPVSTQTILGLVKVGSGLNVATDGTLSTVPNIYTAGSGLTLSGNQFSLPVTVTGSGTFVQNITQTANGLAVTLGTPSGSVVPSGTLMELQTGTSANDRVWSPLIINQWYNNNRLAIHVSGSSPVISGAIRFYAGNNITLSQTGGDITINATPTGAIYTAGSGLTLTANQFSLPVSYVGSGNYVQNVVQNSGGLTVTLGTLPTGSAYTAGNGLTLTGTVFSLPVTVTGSGNVVTDVTQTSTGINVSKGTFSPALTVKDYGIVNGTTVIATAMRNRLVVDSSTTFTVQDGIIEGQELVIVPCTFSGDMSFTIKNKNACGTITTSSILNFTTAIKSFTFWWSQADSAWVALQ